MQFLRDKCPVLVRAIHPRTCAVAFLAVLYIVGLLHWMSVFDFALFRVKDWSLVMKYSAVLRDALTHGKVPYVMTYEGHYTNRFLALPEVPLSPQYLLLAWLDDKPFNLLNILLLYSVSFAGLLCLRKEWRLSPVPFTFLYLLFSFNGYIVSRVAVGHTMWYGYFFLPYFHLLVLRITKDPFSERSCILLILVLFLMLLQGSFLLYTWCFLYLALMVLFNPRLWRPIAYVGIGSALVSLFRFLPGAVTFKTYNLPFIGGYPSLSFLLDGLTTIKDFRETYRCGTYNLGWWEFDCYVGLTGAALILYFSLLIRLRDKPMGIPTRFRELDFPNLVMFILCFGETYSIVTQLPIPLFSAQRVSTRFIVVPVTMLVVLAAMRMQDFVARDNPTHAAKSVIVLLLVLMAWGLYLHSSAWRIYSADRFFLNDDVYGAGPEFVRMPALENLDVRRYVQTVQISAVLSCGAILFFVWRFLRARRR
jgi:hypothetical protein